MDRSGDYREYLLERLGKNPAYSAEYLNAALKEGGSTFLVALKDVVDAQQGGITAVAREAKLHRVSLHKMLSDRGNPSLSSIESILDAVNLEFGVRRRESA